jgi:hypothetical protein
LDIRNLEIQMLLLFSCSPALALLTGVARLVLPGDTTSQRAAQCVHANARPDSEANFIMPT